MRLSGFNTRGVNSEPMNGQGIYTVIKTLAALWNVPNPIILALKTVSPSWDVHSLMLKQVPVSWDDCIIIVKSVPLLWHEVGGVKRDGRFAWNISFASIPHTSVELNSRHGRLVRHLGSDAIDQTQHADALIRHVTTTPIGH